MKNKTGLLLVDIGLIISLFTGFGFILTLIGLAMLSSENEPYKKSRNYAIGTLVISIIASILIIPFFAAMSFSGVFIIEGIIGFMIAFIILIILLFFFNMNTFKYFLKGCSETAIKIEDSELAEKCESTCNLYIKALIGACVIGIIFFIFCWVPVLNIILFVISIGFFIWYFVMQILIIIRGWQLYAKV